jgi:hypothetical protein
MITSSVIAQKNHHDGGKKTTSQVIYIPTHRSAMSHWVALTNQTDDSPQC